MHLPIKKYEYPFDYLKNIFFFQFMNAHFEDFKKFTYTNSL